MSTPNHFSGGSPFTVHPPTKHEVVRPKGMTSWHVVLPTGKLACCAKSVGDDEPRFDASRVVGRRCQRVGCDLRFSEIPRKTIAQQIDELEADRADDAAGDK